MFTPDPAMSGCRWTAPSARDGFADICRRRQGSPHGCWSDGPGNCTPCSTRWPPPPSIALIEGEAGVGKTRPIREAIGHPVPGPGRPPGARVLAGACPPLREPFPYGPVFDVLRTLKGAVPERLNPVCGALR